jgi:hypothetical protein
MNLNGLRPNFGNPSEFQDLTRTLSDAPSPGRRPVTVRVRERDGRMFWHWAADDEFYMLEEARREYARSKKPHEPGTFEESREYADAKSVISCHS